MRDRGINGLVLAGGASSRMGQSKSELIYFDRPQWAYCANLLAPYCDKVWVSVEHEDQIDDVPASMQLTDCMDKKGPMTGILSALRDQPDKTWLIMACDMPGIDRTVMNRLIRQRNPDALISCFMREGDKDTVEPLLSFWEAGVIKDVEQFIRQSWSPREFILTHEAHLIELNEEMYSRLKSVNTPEERKEFIKKHSSGNDRYQEI